MKKLMNKLNNNLIDLDVIIKRIVGINNNKRLKKKIETHFKKGVRKIYSKWKRKVRTQSRNLKTKKHTF